jgi:RNA polymerase-binding transcription factor DksA
MKVTTVIATSRPPHSGLSPELLEQLSALLEERHASLVTRVTRLGIDIEALQTMTATHGQGETEHTSSETERAVAAVLESGTLDALEAIASALARLDDGSYGDCARCDAPIGTERLLALPQTPHCIICAN